MREKIVTVGSFILFLCIIINAGPKAYITDSFEITLRTEGSSKARIIAMPKSGTPVEIIKEQGDWAHVRMLAGQQKEGWVLSRYLMNRVPWEDRFNYLSKKYEKTGEKTQTISTENKQLSNKVYELTRDLNACKRELQQVQKDYEDLKKGSTQYVALKEKHDHTVKELLEANTQIEKLGKENSSLKSNERREWFIAGALVIALGFLTGLLIGKREKKRRRYY